MCIWWYRYRFANPNYIIQDVIISDESIITYWNESLYNTLTTSLLGKNQRRLNTWNWSEFQKKIKEAYPLVQDIDVSNTEQIGVVYADVTFVEPKLSVSNQKNLRVVRDNNTYLVDQVDSIQEGTTQLRLPSYTDEYDSLEGLFFVLHDTTLSQIIDNITDILDSTKIVDIEYDPGAKKIHITYENKLILFHLDKWLDEQLAKLLDISQYYTSYQNVSKIDLWSSDDIIVR